MKTYLASSASSPASTSHTRHLSLTPSTQPRSIHARRQLHHQKMATGNILRIQHQNKSDQSSSDDGMPQPIMHHRIAAGIHMAHNKTIAPAGFISEAIEMKNLCHHRTLDYEDSVKTTSTTISPITMSSDQGRHEMNFPINRRANVLEKEDCFYKRSRSYHGKGSFIIQKLSL